jgi:hypothetical protein
MACGGGGKSKAIKQRQFQLWSFNRDHCSCLLDVFLPLFFLVDLFTAISFSESVAFTREKIIVSGL